MNPEENAADLRLLIRKQLSNLKIEDHIKRLLNEAKEESEGAREIFAEEVLERVRGLGVIDNVIQRVSAHVAKQHEGAAHATDLQAHGPPPSASELKRTALKSHDHRYLFLRIKGGFGFTQYIVDPPTPGETMVVTGSLFGQRFVSKPVPAALEPRFDVAALVQLPGGRASSAQDVLAAAPEPRLHLSVVRVTRPADAEDPASQPSSSSSAAGPYDPIWGPFAKAPGTVPTAAAARVGRRALCGSAWVDWRKVLVSGVGRQLSTTVELLSPLGGGGVGGGPLVPAGTLELKLEVLPGPDAPLDPSELKTIQRQEATSDAHKSTALMARTRSWFTDTAATHPVLRERSVALIAYGEDGVQRPITSFLRPLLPPRSIPTVRHAARFVSLLQSSDESRVLGPLGAHCVSSPQSIAASGRATNLDRALLLASLFRGFYLNAWVCVGSDPRGPHFWVCTIDSSTGGGAFWEPLTGRRFPLADVMRPGGSPYITLDSLFNHEKVLINVQPDNVLLSLGCHLDFDDARKWKPFRAFDEEAPGAMGPDGAAYPSLQLSDSAAALTASLPLLEGHLEADLRRLVASYRARDLGIARTTFDARLEPLLMPALDAYEKEAVAGAPLPGTEEFTESIKAAVPAGCTFQGFPSNHTTLDARAVFEAISGQVPAQAILRADGQLAQFAVRAKVTAYAEDVCSVWVMLAAKVSPADPLKKVIYRPASGPGKAAAAGARGVNSKAQPGGAGSGR